ncbi:hypothetical protein SK128_010588, partial [Halocaridina rubra]
KPLHGRNTTRFPHPKTRINATRSADPHESPLLYGREAGVINRVSGHRSSAVRPDNNDRFVTYLNKLYIDKSDIFSTKRVDDPKEKCLDSLRKGNTEERGLPVLSSRSI